MSGEASWIELLPNLQAVVAAAFGALALGVGKWTWKWAQRSNRLVRQLRWTLPVSVLKRDFWVYCSIVENDGYKFKSFRTYTHSCELLAIEHMSDRLSGSAVHFSIDNIHNVDVIKGNALFLGLYEFNAQAKDLLNNNQIIRVAKIPDGEPDEGRNYLALNKEMADERGIPHH